jgi:glutamyl-tRNA synthetase
LSEAPHGKNPEVIRLAVEPKTVSFHDIVRGTVKFDTELIDDFVIAKSLESPLYNLAVTIDDYEMEITHVIRGEEHISNTPRQILILEALHLPQPEYGHLPLILNAQRSKLSKREADVAVLDYRSRGYLPEAIVNFLVLMGWHPSHDKEVFTLDELVQEFDISRVQKAGAIFNEEKLNWLNREHMKKLSAEELDARLEPFLNDSFRKASPDVRMKIIQAVRDRMVTLVDFNGLADFFVNLPEYPAELLVWKKGSRQEAKSVLKELLDISRTTKVTRDPQAFEKELAPLIVTYGKGNVLWPLRAALSGQEASPDPYIIASTLTNEELVRRLESALRKLP